MLHIEYQISEDDFVAAAKLAIRKRKKSAGLTIKILQIMGDFLLLRLS